MYGEYTATDLVVLDVWPVYQNYRGDWHYVHHSVPETQVNVTDVTAVLSVMTIWSRLVVLQREVKVV